MPQAVIHEELRLASTEDRVSRLLRMSLDRCEDILSADPLTCPAPLLNAQVQTVRAIFTAAIKMGLESQRLAAERDRIIGELSAAFREGVPRSE